MQEAGYRTAVAGKWQLYGAEHYSKQFRGKGALPKQSGFDHHCLWQVDKLGSRYHQPLLHIDGVNKQFKGKTYGPTLTADHMIKFMAKPSEKPFFIYYAMIIPHSPFLPTPDSKNPKSKNKQKNFEDMVAYMDKMVGRLVDQAKKQGIADNTLIMFTGDNGTGKQIMSKLNGRSIQGGKGKTTDAGTRAPLVAYWPGTIKPGQVCDELVSFDDFLPTVRDLAGKPLTKQINQAKQAKQTDSTSQRFQSNIDGQSIVPLLKGETSGARKWTYCYYCPRPERTKPVYFIRDKRWKLYDDGRFIDVKNDVLEKSPLSKADLQGDAKQAYNNLAAALKTLPRKGQSLLKYE